MRADQALTVSGEGQEIDARIVVTEPFEILARLRIPDKDAGGMNILASILTGVGFLLVLISFGARKKTKGIKHRINDGGLWLTEV